MTLDTCFYYKIILFASSCRVSYFCELLVHSNLIDSKVPIIHINTTKRIELDCTKNQPNLTAFKRVNWIYDVERSLTFIEQHSYIGYWMYEWKVLQLELLKGKRSKREILTYFSVNKELNEWTLLMYPAQKLKHKSFQLHFKKMD